MARIGLDARMAGSVPTGLDTYAVQLTCALSRLDPDNSYVVIRGPGAAVPLASDPNVEEVVLPGDLDTPSNLARGRAISRLDLDLYHSLHHFLPLRLRVRRVVLTLHDLIWVEHPDLIIDGRFGAIHRTATHWFGRAAMGYAIRRADHVIAISNHTRRRASVYYGLNSELTSVVHHGVDHRAYTVRVGRSSSSPPYFLVLGNTRPYKDIPTALRAFSVCARRHPEVQLVIAGRGDSARALETLAASLGIAGRIRFAGPLPHRDLLDLIHGATALVFPSLVEGFGLPVLEAMAAGCAVIASRIPTIVEVVDTAAFLCDARQPDQFAAAMMGLLEDDALRSDLVRRGCDRAAAFSWERCAAGTLAVYRKLL